MKVALVFPFPDIEKRQIKINGKIPPLGILYVAGSLRAHGHEVVIVDANANEYSVEKTAAVIEDFRPDIVGISSNTPNYALVKRLAREIRRRRDVPVGIGGPHSSNLPAECLNTGVFDFVVVGEGELSFAGLVNHFNDREYLKTVPGIGFIHNSKVIVNPQRIIEDIDILPPKAWDLIDLKKYCPSPASYRKLPAISTILARGCSKKCVYCCVSSVFSRTVRLHSPEKIYAELEFLRRQGIKDINFWDSVFTYDHEWVRKVCRITKELGLIWNCNARVDMVDADILRLMAESGCYEIGYGLEVSSNQSLELINKETSYEKALDSIALTRKAGIMVKTYFMIGFPWEKEEDIRATVSFAKRINPDFATFSIASPYPGCHLFEELRADLANQDFDGMNHLSGKYVVSRYFSGSELSKMVSRAYKSYYLRPRYVFNSVKRMRSWEDVKRSFQSVKDIFFSR